MTAILPDNFMSQQVKGMLRNLGPEVVIELALLARQPHSDVTLMVEAMSTADQDRLIGYHLADRIERESLSPLIVVHPKLEEIIRFAAVACAQVAAIYPSELEEYLSK